MSDNGVARVDLDHAGGVIATGAQTVFTNNRKTAIVGNSTIGGPPNTGDTILSSPAPKVFVENKPIATVGSVTAKGYAVGKASTDVFAGNS